MNTDKKTKWLSRGEKYCQYIHEDVQGGLLDLSIKNGEYNRTHTILMDLRWLLGLGYIEQAKHFASIGLELLQRSIKKRQTRSAVNILPKSIDYHRLNLRHEFMSCLSDMEESAQLDELFGLAYNEYNEDVNKKAYRNAKDMRYLCVILATRTGNFGVASKLVSLYNASFKVNFIEDIDIAIHETFLQELALAYLANRDSSLLSKVRKCYDLFFTTLGEVPPRLIPPQLNRSLGAAEHASYIYYKYIQDQVPFDPVLPIQSVFYGQIYNRVIKEWKVPNNSIEADRE